MTHSQPCVLKNCFSGGFAVRFFSRWLVWDANRGVGSLGELCSIGRVAHISTLELPLLSTSHLPLAWHLLSPAAPTLVMARLWSTLWG